MLEPRQDSVPGSIHNIKFQTGKSPCTWQSAPLSHPLYHMIFLIQHNIYLCFTEEKNRVLSNGTSHSC